jgi:hypothetical protein
VRALDIEVSDDLARRWLEWFSPSVQPFLVDDALASTVARHATEASLSAELRDTYCLYGPAQGLRCLWLDEAGFLALPRAQRSALVRAQVTQGREVVPSVRAWAPVLGEVLRSHGDGHRFVWWPSLLAGIEERVLRDYVEEGRRPSRHDEVPAGVWDAAVQLLPQARRLAGTFPAGSGPNCFGTVMAAAGVPGAEAVWMQREPFEHWLAERTRPGGRDDEPGTVLVWRSPDGRVQHAAVTLGDGWVLHKPSQGWMSPTKVLTVAECKASSRAVGRRLERRSLVGRPVVSSGRA